MLDYIFTRDFSYRFHTIKSREDFLAKISLRPDLVIMDPKVIGGTEIFGKLKEQQLDPYIILLVKDQQEKEAAQLQAHDYYFEHDPLEQLTAKSDHFIRKIRESGR